MRKEYLGYKRIAIPIITMALIVSSWMPSMNVGNFIGEHRDGVAIVEMYNSEALAATVDYNKVQKTYNVKVFIDSAENEIQFTKDSGKPFIALNRTFIPYRVMGEALGAKVDWDNNLRKVTATGNNNKVEMYIGHKTYGVNGNVKQMDVEPFILASEGRTYIPARYITEGLNYTIDFTQADGKMYIVAFTQGQSETEIKAILQDVANGVSSAKSTPVTPTKPAKQEFNNAYVTPHAEKGTYKQEGNHYIINGDFEGVWETEKYAILKHPSSIGTGADVVTIYPKAMDFSKIAVTCTSHPELNTLNYYGSINDMTRPNLQYQLNGQGYDIPIVEGMIIELQEAGGDTFTITI